MGTWSGMGGNSSKAWSLNGLKTTVVFKKGSPMVRSELLALLHDLQNPLQVYKPLVNSTTHRLAWVGIACGHQGDDFISGLMGY